MTRLLPALLLLVSPALTANQEPLVDRIWSTADSGFVDEGDLHAALAAADIILLGEVHDRAEHHLLQAEMLSWASAGRRPGVVLEMLGPEQAAALDEWQEADSPDPSRLGPAVGWADSGWPDWKLYEPIAETAVQHRLRLHPGAPEYGLFRRVIREGLNEVLTPDQAAALALDRDLPPGGRERLVQRLEEAHCGLDDHMPVERMVDAQRLRDAAMSRALLDAHEHAGAAVLIAGNGHVHRGYGVPVYLEDLAAELEVISVGLLPAEGFTTDADGVPDHPGLGAYDFARFTSGRPPAGSCEEEA